MGAVCDTSQTSGKAPPQRVRRGFICTSLGTLFPSPSAHGLRERPSSSQRRLAWAPTDTHPADLLHTQMSSADDVLLDDGGERPQLVCVSQAASAEPGAGRPAPRQRCEDTSWVSSARSPLAHRHPFRSLFISQEALQSDFPDVFVSQEFLETKEELKSLCPVCNQFLLEKKKNGKKETQIIKPLG
ncbi:uncharacterized protein LOC110358279 isoform X2 [Columba livia]|uniref:uncharacterized protein LOC110358279 isoform X2 n=1 Tax=Columba livia TaxID=8932 RepID=UPI0031BBBE69